MLKPFFKFAADEEGAVTVEWVVLTAAIVGLTVSAYMAIDGASGTLSANTNTTLSDMTVGDPVIGE